MKRQEYKKELKFLYGMAVYQKNAGLALEILEKGREAGVEEIMEKENVCTVCGKFATFQVEQLCSKHYKEKENEMSKL